MFVTYFIHYTVIQAYKHTSSHLFHPLYAYPDIQTHFLPPISSTIHLSRYTNTLPPCPDRRIVDEIGGKKCVCISG